MEREMDKGDAEPGAATFFEPRERYKWQILCAATLKGLNVPKGEKWFLT
jgi:hypothetical protein